MRHYALVTVGLVCCLSSGVGAQDVGVKRVVADDMRLIPLQTKLRYSTMVILPEGETVIEVSNGDALMWQIDAALNIVTIKPSKEGAATNLNLITSSGGVYSFLLTENSARQPDLKVYVASNRQYQAKAKYFSAEQVEAIQAELASAKLAVVSATKQGEEAKAEAKTQVARTLRTYDVAAALKQRPFLVSAIWGDDTHTYIRSSATELPAVYEVVDGSLSLVNFQVTDGMYVIPKVVRQGYLVLGKAKFSFAESGR